MPLPSPWLRMFVRCLALHGFTGRSPGRAFSPYDHAGINFLLRADEEFAAGLDIIQRVSRADDGLHGNHYAARPALEERGICSRTRESQPLVLISRKTKRAGISAGPLQNRNVFFNYG